MRAVLAALLASLTLVGCAPDPAPPKSINDRALNTYIATLPATTLAARRTPDGPLESFQASRKLSFRVDRIVEGKQVTCGYVGYAAPPGTPPIFPPPPDVIFAFDGTITLGRNLSHAQALEIQRRYCGPDWIEPNTNPWVS